ncbi:hypothetical protein BU23DRAFT_193616 [Bimuria novae-zelandiae CBS 107.79]|uniref:Uncharacterized protein n=1 Tax=Bimuria novae-zelandiae CBS 107.79 TaxID=1447943 RepID=A0A6A5VR46_9PLEO|nr:hypothetical protein BU23DRAFT_193616 [Bimuria novae-zelandiae CBS 107.79]
MAASETVSDIESGRQFDPPRRYDLCPHIKFFKELKNGFLKDPEARHMALLFVTLQVYAFRMIWTNSILAAAIALPAWLIPYVIREVISYHIFGFKLEYFLPWVGCSHPFRVWDEEFSVWFRGPRVDIFASYYYMIPLYLGLWYSAIATFSSTPLNFLVLVSILFVAGPEYWISRGVFEDRDLRNLKWFLLSILWRVTAGIAVWIFWTPAWDNVAATIVTCVLVMKVLRVWNGVTGLWPSSTLQPYDPYYEQGAEDEEVIGWMCVQNKKEYVHRQWMIRRIHKRRGRRRASARGHRHFLRKIFHEDAAEPEISYREDAPEPEALYRSDGESESDSSVPESHNVPEDIINVHQPPVTPSIFSRQEREKIQGQIRKKPLIANDSSIIQRAMAAAFSNAPPSAARQPRSLPRPAPKSVAGPSTPRPPVGHGRGSLAHPGGQSVAGPSTPRPPVGNGRGSLAIPQPVQHSTPPTAPAAVAPPAKQANLQARRSNADEALARIDAALPPTLTEIRDLTDRYIRKAFGNNPRLMKHMIARQTEAMMSANDPIALARKQLERIQAYVQLQYDDAMATQRAGLNKPQRLTQRRLDEMDIANAKFVNRVPYNGSRFSFIQFPPTTT